MVFLLLLHGLTVRGDGEEFGETATRERASPRTSCMSLTSKESQMKVKETSEEERFSYAGVKPSFIRGVI